MGGVLVDTDILIRAYQAGGGDPRSGRAKDALEDLARRGDGYLSIQNLAEFSRVVQAKVDPPVPASKVRETIAQLERVFDVLRPSSDTLHHALLGVEKHGLEFWDSMVWALAHENGLSEVLTEDLPPRALIEGVRYRNPLA
ncbi:MAG: PIN domain-containing protein [Planctomycetes bacterium]|nr:PIN domain-containing protein [Planctomycetota bacterium]